MSSHWMPTETLYVPHKRGPSYPYDDEIVSGIKIHASSADDCLNICTAMSIQCYSSLYNTMTGLCEMYIQSDTNSYILNTISDNYTTAYIRSCDAGKYCYYLTYFAYCKGGNFNIHIWVWFSYFICLGRDIRFYL